MPIKDLPNGNKLITAPNAMEKVLIVLPPPGFEVVIIPANELPQGPDEWSNTEIDNYLLIKKTRRFKS